MEKNTIKAKSFYSKNNKGFSFIEVLVCVAILVIISIPIFQTFTHAARNTGKAHSTQQITEYAQTTMEIIKQKPVSQLDSVLLAPSASPSKVLTPHTAYPTAPDTLFETITYTQDDINVGGELYSMKVVLDPLPYSMGAAAAPSPALTAEDINVYKMTKVSDTNGLLYPIIADEINSHEIKSGAINDMIAELSDMQYGSVSGGSDAAKFVNLYNKTEKIVKVTISDVAGTTEAKPSPSPGAAQHVYNKVNVACDVTYKMVYGASINVEKIYNVYNTTFDLDGIIDDSGKVDWERGGKVFIFAKAYQEQNPPAAGTFLQKNTIMINNTYSGSVPLDIFLVRGYYGSKLPTDTRSGVNFDNVFVNGFWYSTVPDTADLSGEYKDVNTNFYTNIKGMLINRQLTSADFEQTIGFGEENLRCYQVSLQLTDANGQLVVDLESTKQIDE